MVTLDSAVIGANGGFLLLLQPNPAARRRDGFQVAERIDLLVRTAAHGASRVDTTVVHALLFNQSDSCDVWSRPSPAMCICW